jgi:hypothetical protein
MNFKDAYNPKKEEIKEWAYTENVYEPVQDWDLMITDTENAELLLQLVNDEKCFHQSYFLKCLYLLVGDHVRTKGTIHDKEVIEKVMKQGSNSQNEKIKIWAERSKELMQNTETFDYTFWCDGGFNR